MFTLLVLALVVKLIYDGIVRFFADVRADHIYKIYQELESAKNEGENSATEDQEITKEEL